MGAGIAMAPGDIAFKSNFATLDPATGVVLRRRADRRFEALGPQLCAALDGAPQQHRFSHLMLRRILGVEHTICII